jgi:YggT family protein
MDKYQLIAFSINFVVILGNLLIYAIIGRVLVSWFSMGKFGQRGRFSQLLFDITDPVVNIARKLPHKIGMIDLSPLITLIGIDLLVRLITTLLSKLLV